MEKGRLRYRQAFWLQEFMLLTTVPHTYLLLVSCSLSHIWLCKSMDCRLLGFFVHGIIQERIMEWVVKLLQGNFPNPGLEPKSSALQVDSLRSEPPWKLLYHIVYLFYSSIYKYICIYINIYVYPCICVYTC